MNRRGIRKERGNLKIINSILNALIRPTSARKLDKGGKGRANLEKGVDEGKILNRGMNSAIKAKKLRVVGKRIISSELVFTSKGSGFKKSLSKSIISTVRVDRGTGFQRSRRQAANSGDWASQVGIVS